MHPEFKKRLEKVKNRASYMSFGAGFCLFIQTFIFYRKPWAVFTALAALILTAPGLRAALKDFDSDGKTDI